MLPSWLAGVAVKKRAALLTTRVCLLPPAVWGEGPASKSIWWGWGTAAAPSSTLWTPCHVARYIACVLLLAKLLEAEIALLAETDAQERGPARCREILRSTV